MKNALILHGTNNTPQHNWIPWLKVELEKEGYNVFSPQLPQADKPSIQRYNNFLLKESFNFNEETILIGHSSGAVAVLGLLQALPESTKVSACYLIGAFKDDLDWESLNELFIPELDFKKIKNKSEKFIFIHSDNDPYCPLDHADYLSKNVDGKLIVLPNQYHFSISTAGEKYKEFPELLELIKDEKN